MNFEKSIATKLRANELVSASTQQRVDEHSVRTSLDKGASASG